MKTIWRNFLNVLRHFKMATLLNIVGLSVAFTAFTLILMQQEYHYNFDRMHSGVESIFRVHEVNGGVPQPILYRPFARAFATSSPHIVSSALSLEGGGLDNLAFTITRNGAKERYKEPRMLVTPQYPLLFAFDIVEGDRQALEDPQKALIPLSMAQKWFGNESAVGRQLDLSGGKGYLVIGGVFRDFPLNSSVVNAIYYSIDPKENYDNWKNQNYTLYIRLDDPANNQMVVDNFEKTYDIKAVLGEDASWGPDGKQIELAPLTDLHFLTNVQWDTFPKADRPTLLILLAIGFVIVGIAGINFINFSTALMPMRIKSINTQKVLGSSEGLLRAGIVVEAVGISVLAYLLSLVWLHICSLSSIASFVDADIRIGEHPGIVAITGGLAVCVGLLAGLYPAYYITSFPPALVLKGSFGLSPKGRQLRNVLIGIQFVVSFVLIIGAIFMYLQNYFMQHAPLGYNTDQVIVAEINANINKSRTAFTQQLKSSAGIEDVAYGNMVLGSRDDYMGWGRMYKNTYIHFQCLPVDPAFFKVMGIEISDGRAFREEDANAPKGLLIFNERARTEFDMQLNEQVNDMEIIGFIRDVKFASFRTPVAPMAFLVWGKYEWGGDRPVSYSRSYIKVKAGHDLRAAMNHVKQTLEAFDSDYLFDVRFYDEVLNRTYKNEQKIGKLITLFSLLTVFISIVGVFGLVVFDSEYRKKEIGIRKVLGSTTEEILLLFNKTYICILLICFVLAVPLAWYGVHRWLENFAYKTPMYVWVYGVAFLAVMIITVLTVTFQNWKTANANPVDSIKSE